MILEIFCQPKLSNMKLTWFRLLPECQSVTNASLVCGDGVVTSHKLIVAGISEFLRSLMEEAIPSNDTVTIIMPDFETIIVERMIGDVLTKDAASNSGIGQAFKIPSYSESVTVKTEKVSKIKEMPISSEAVSEANLKEHDKAGGKEETISLEEEDVKESTLNEVIEFDEDDTEDNEETEEDIPEFKQLGNGEFLDKNIDKYLGGESKIKLRPGGRGTEYNWKETMTFKTSDEYYKSDFYNELKEDFTNKRKRLIESESAMVYWYTCKNANRKRFLPCPKAIKVTIETDTTAVTVEEVYTHEHILNVEYEQIKASQFYWSENSSAIVRE